MRDGVDEVCEAGQGGGEAHGWPVERHDEDLGVVEECAGDIYVVCDEGADDVAADVAGGFGGDFALDVGATGEENC